MNVPTMRFVFDRKNTATASDARMPRQGLVQIEVTIGRKRKWIGTGVKVFADQWYPDGEQHIINCADAPILNGLLDVAMSKVRKEVLLDLANGRQRMPNVDDKSDLSLEAYAKQYLLSLRGRSDGSLRTWLAYAKKFGEFKKFCSIGSISRNDLSDFDNYLADVGLGGTTRNLIMSFAKRVLTVAFERGDLQENPAVGLRMPRKTVADREYLTEAEIAQLAKATGLSDADKKHRDCFLFQCYTGLSYSDIKTLTPDMIVQEGGKSFIVRNRQKTKTRYRVMLLKPAVEILNRYGGVLPIHHRVSHYDYRLERIGKKCGIKKKLTSHVGRHTFATWALSKGVPIEVVSKMLGHTNIQTTQIYAKVLAKDVDAQFERLDKMI